MTKEQEVILFLKELNRNRATGLIKNKINETLSLIQEQQAEIEKKDKMANNMIVNIRELNNSRRKYNCRFNKKCDENGCGVCIYKYFERKVEE